MEHLTRQRRVMHIGKPMDKHAYFEELGNHKFVASPPDKGQDCHRTYEALAMGSIPIVSRSLRSLFKTLKVNVVELEDDEWENLTNINVTKKFRKAEQLYDYRIPEALYLRYGKGRINKGV
ncbi:unnamed protein product [Prorocentrum cordatum]|uniref:Uncharacterized protein n=1 Tax=Prorocentrum cordatum TaxID=2364126 RepID=A0ABN9S5Q7_9DINO|nr:unnamed protein product [Polarella glacialis]